MESLPDSLVQQCLSHLLPLLHDLRCCSAVSKTFRRVTLALEAEQTAVSRGQLEGRFARRLDKVLVVLRALPNLRALDLTQAGWADGRLLAQLPRTCPRLATLILSGIDCLFDADVAPLAACRELKEIDLTFCQKTSYGSVIALRRPEPSVAEGPPPALRHIKRLPPWLCGAFECPWGETHYYYPDGAFSFTRGALPPPPAPGPA